MSSKSAGAGAGKGALSITLAPGQMRILADLDSAIRELDARRQAVLLAIMAGAGVERFQIVSLDAETRILSYTVPARTGGNSG